MQLVCEISLYPLRENYIPAIQDFIDRINQYSQLTVITNATSTQVAGDYSEVMTILGKEMQLTHEKVGQAIFVCKFLNGDKMSGELK